MVFLGIDLGKIFSLPFWLEVSPGELSPLFEKYFLGLTFFLWAIFGISKLVQKYLHGKRGYIIANYWQKIATFSLTMAVSFSFIFFFRYEAIPILGGRFWILLWVIVGFVWIIYLIKYYFKDLKKQLK